MSVQKQGQHLRTLRKSLGLSCRQMSELLGFSKENGERRIRYIEAEGRNSAMAGAASKLMRYIEQGAPLKSGLQISLPKYVVADGIDGEEGCFSELVMRLEYPRFIAVTSESAFENHDCRQISDLEWLVVAQWIDEPIGHNVDELLAEAAEAFADYVEECERLQEERDRELVEEADDLSFTPAVANDPHRGK